MHKGDIMEMPYKRQRDSAMKRLSSCCWRKVQMNAQGEHYEQALQAAAFCGHEEIVAVLENWAAPTPFHL